MGSTTSVAGRVLLAAVAASGFLLSVTWAVAALVVLCAFYATRQRTATYRAIAPPLATEALGRTFTPSESLDDSLGLTQLCQERQCTLFALSKVDEEQRGRLPF